MTTYIINPTKIINPDNFNNIMTNLIQDISKLFTSNLKLIEQSNYKNTTMMILQIFYKFLKIYKFYDYNIKNINMELLNKNLEIVIGINIIINKTHFMTMNTTWLQFYFGKINKSSIVYYNLPSEQKNLLNLSILNKDFYFYQVDMTNPNYSYKQAFILKNKYCPLTNICSCEYYDYIITLYW